jgi:YD repeat-containing protein
LVLRFVGFDLVTVTQRKGTAGTTQTRTFAYDSLSRLTLAANPESGSTSYQYDSNGNLRVKTDARGVSAHYDYDALNRLKRRWYNGSSLVTEMIHNQPALPSSIGATDEVNYAYDSGCPTCNTKGRLISVSSSASTYSYGSYDAVGRVLSVSQTLGGQPYPMSYEYDLAGHVTKMTYPSTRKINYAYDAAGRANSVTGTLGKNPNAQPDNYATGIIYDAGGRMTKEQFGTTTPVYNKLLN